MIVTPVVEDANVKVVGIIAFPGAIVMDRLTTALTFCVIWWNPTIRLLLACLPVTLTKVLSSWDCCAFLCFHVT